MVLYFTANASRHLTKPLCVRSNPALIRCSIPKPLLVRQYRISAMEDCISPEQVATNYNEVRDNVQKAWDSSPAALRHGGCPRLVAVSKTKPVELIRAAYDQGQRVFGENYVQELMEKAASSIIADYCADIKWVFIGTLQSNKINKLLSTCANLDTIETVTSIKMADQLSRACTKRPPALDGDEELHPLNVFVQVNTSGEEQKGGLSPHEAIECASHIIDACPALNLRGFMTIGALAHSIGSAQQQQEEGGGGANPDFACLRKTRDDFAAARGLTDVGSIELSMGMSADYVPAIQMGSSNVRVGSTIFGARQEKPVDA